MDYDTVEISLVLYHFLEYPSNIGIFLLFLNAFSEQKNIFIFYIGKLLQLTFVQNDASLNKDIKRNKMGLSYAKLRACIDLPDF